MSTSIGGISIDENKIIDLLKDLVKINSVNPLLQTKAPGEREIAEFLGSYLKRLGLKVHIDEVADDRWNCVAILRGTKGPNSGRDLILNGHTDVVPADAMRIEPFIPKVEAGRVYGRGASDMKCGLATMVMAAECLVEAKLDLEGDLILAFVADEEYSSLGTEHFLRQGYRADGAIVLEPSQEELIYTHKGFAWIKVKVNGKAAHGSRPEDGINAISKAAKLIAEVDARSAEISKARHPVLGPSLIHNSLISGGSDISTIPALCEVDFEQRILPGQTREDVESEFRTIIDKIKESDPEFDASADVYFTRTPLSTPENSTIVGSLRSAYRKHKGKGIGLVGGGFWTDAALLSESGIPSVLFGSIGAGFHEDIEFVEIDSLVGVTEIIIDTVLDFCGIS